MPNRQREHTHYTASAWESAYNRVTGPTLRSVIRRGYAAWTADGCPTGPVEERPAPPVLTPMRKMSAKERKAKREEGRALMARMAADDKERGDQIRLALPRLWARYFDRVGVELEGGWTRTQMEGIERQELLRAGEPIQTEDGTRMRLSAGERFATVALRRMTDGSVSVSQPSGAGRAEQLTHIGELGVGPTSDLKAMSRALQTHWPKVVNATCGLHIHLSVKRDVYYLRLMDPEVTTLLCNGLGEWGRASGLPAGHPLWQRLSGENRFCSPVYRAENQVGRRDKGGDRYTALNYCRALHGTVEARILPMFATPDQGIAAMYQIITTLGMWLHSKRGTERLSGAEQEVIEQDATSEVTTLLDSGHAGFRAYSFAY